MRARRDGIKPMVPPDAQCQPLIDETTALFQVADELYTNERYKVQAAPSEHQ